MRGLRFRQAARAGLVVCAACAIARGNQRFWNGGGADNDWSTAGNWAVFFGVPANDGTDDIIMQGILRPNPLVDIDYNILSLQFSGGGGAGPFVISNSAGADLTILGGGIINNDADLQIISRVGLGANHTWNAAAGPLQVNFVALGGLATGSMLTVSGAFDTSIQGTIGGSAITNAGSILLNSSANLTLGGLASNTFTGPVTVNGGTLLLNKSAGINAVPGNLIIGDGAGSDVVRLLQNNQIADTSNVTINSSGLLNLNGHSETINNLTINGGDVTMGNGTLFTSGALAINGGTLSVGNGAVAITGALSMNGGVLSVGSGAVGFGAASTISSATVSGGTIHGASILSVTNSTIAGLYVHADLDLTAANINSDIRKKFVNLTVRAASTPTTVNRLESPGDIFGQGAISINVEDGPAVDDLVVTGNVEQTGLGPDGQVTKGGNGQVRFSGATITTSLFDVDAGTVILNSGVQASNLVEIGSPAQPAVLRYGPSGSIQATEVRVHASSLYDLDGNSDAIDQLVLRGGIVTTGLGTLFAYITESAPFSATSTISGRLSTNTIVSGNGTALINLDIPAVLTMSSAGTISGGGTVRLGAINQIPVPLSIEGGVRVLAANDQAFGTAVVTITDSTLAADGAPHTIGNFIAIAGNSGVSGDQPLTLSGPLGIATNATLTKSGGAMLSLSGQQVHGPGAILAVNERAVRIGTDAGLNLTINVTAPSGQVDFLASQHIAALTVNAGNAIIEIGGSSVVVAKSLTVDTTDALIDVWEHAVIIDYTGGSPLTSIRSAILSGYDNGSWNGFGITSSLADATTYAVGYGEATTLGLTSFEGESLDGPALLVKYTYYGDANLDGTVNVADLVKLASNWNSAGLWTEGDFNYDGFVNKIDLGRMAVNWHAGNIAPLGPALEALGLPAVVPQPFGLAVIALVACPLIRARRRR